MKNARLLAIILVTLSIASCRSRVDLEKGTFSGRHVRLGSKVALIDKNIEVVLVKDGRVFMSDLSGSYKEIYKMERWHAWMLLRSVKRSGIRDKNIDNPGIMLTYYVQYNSKKGQYSWVWGKDGAKPPEELGDEFDEILQLFNKEKSNSLLPK